MRHAELMQRVDPDQPRGSRLRIFDAEHLELLAIHAHSIGNQRVMMVLGRYWTMNIRNRILIAGLCPTHNIRNRSNCGSTLRRIYSFPHILLSIPPALKVRVRTLSSGERGAASTLSISVSQIRSEYRHRPI